MATRTQTDFYAGKIIENVVSYDRSSSYPDVQVNCKYPIGEFYHSGHIEYDELLHIIDDREHAVIMQIALTDVELHEIWFGCPYLSKDKCRNIKNALYDNGRILEAEYLETTITDIDLKIILKEYDFDDIYVIDSWHTKYGYLPESMREVDRDYYNRKTELKGVEGQEVYYMKSKNKLNSVYGMSAQDPVKQDIIFDPLTLDFKEGEEDEEKILQKYEKKAFLPYQWGVWTTAWARYRLHEGIWIAGQNFIYCDTDSVKFIDDMAIRSHFDCYNANRIKDSTFNRALATDKHGEIHYMGVYEHDDSYLKFKTLGAKKYCYITEDGKLHITIAGVNKRKGAEELEEYNGIESFEPGFLFVKGGGTESVYNDIPDVKSLTFEGRKIPITSNVSILDSTYRLGITGEYERLLKNLPVI